MRSFLAVLFALLAQPAVGQEGGSGRRCAVLGDSLAVGAARHAPGCEVRARVGIGSAEFARTYAVAPVRADAVLISLGANDGGRADTLDHLATVRAAVVARSVTGGDGLHLTARAYWAVAQIAVGAAAR
ncbi:hypothetical protein [Roseomonas mucosa]|uniref:hypothetical protein n=1 Tax=Roseomonas mucosa TaxID=207340 RepID=UPI00324B26BA